MPFFALKKIFKHFISNLPSKKNDLHIFDILQKKIGYSFNEPSLLEAALSHTSLPSSTGDASSFERMEFLGDSVLGLIVAEELFLKHPKYAEGKLSKLKSKIVSRKMLTLKAKELQLEKYLLLSTEAVSGSGIDSILSDAMESLICAIYLDGELDDARMFIKKFILKDIKKMIDKGKFADYKSMLQEYTQSKFHNIPQYNILKEEGPEHEKMFDMEVVVNGKVLGMGKGNNKKEAQQNAAKEACKQLNL